MKLLFKVFPQKSHYNATFPFAQALRAAGHEVVYAGLAPLRGHVEAQSFRYHVEEEDIFHYIEHQRGMPKVSLWSILRNGRRIHLAAKAKRRTFARSDVFGRLLRTLQPDLILVDSPYTFYALSLYQHTTPFALLESMMPLDRAPGCPPLDTSYVPNRNGLSRCICALHWSRYFAKRALYGLIGLRADYNRRFVLAAASRFGVDRSALSFERYFHLGLRNVPEFILSPQALDFPRRLQGNQVHVGTSVDVNRREVASDYGFRARFSRFAEARKSGTPLVYCSLGTAGWRYAGAEPFFRRVLKASIGRRWNLIVAVGSEVPLERFGVLPGNVAVFQVVPQLDVLRQCDLMITHGGMNSISECALLGVPMLVYPGTKEIDQAGNAARVVFHGAGLTGNLATESAAAIARKTERILCDPRFRDFIARLRAKLVASAITPGGADALLHRIIRPEAAKPPLRGEIQSASAARNRLPKHLDASASRVAPG